MSGRPRLEEAKLFTRCKSKLPTAYCLPLTAFCLQKVLKDNRCNQMGSRRHSREYALQMLFQHDMTGDSLPEISKNFWEGKQESEDVRDFAESLVAGTVDQMDRIDPIIKRQAEHWRLERMATVDRNILRLAVYELLAGTAPAAVVINEAIEIARKFSTDESTQFVNGILDGIRKELLRSAESK